MTVSEPLTATSFGGGSSVTPLYPDVLSGDPAGVNNFLLITCGWGNSTNTPPVTPEKSTPVSNKALTSNVATLTILAGHGWTAGTQVVVAGVDATFNGTYTLTGVTATTISYAKVAADVASQAATGTARGVDGDLIHILDDFGGAGSWALNTGPRGHSAWYKISDGTEVGWSAHIINSPSTNGAMRAAIHRCGKTNLNWETPVAVSADDTSLDTAFAIAPGSNPGGAPGDHVFLCASWTPQTATASGVSTALVWPGAGLTGTNFRSTGSVANGFGMRFGIYSGSVTGVATGNVSGALTLSEAGAGTALIIRLRDSGDPPGANAGENQTVEPNSLVTLDGSASEGNLEFYHWTQVSGPSVTLGGTTSDAARTFTAPTDVAGSTLVFELQVEDVSSNLSNVDTVTITVMEPTEFIGNDSLLQFWEDQ